MGRLGYPSNDRTENLAFGVKGHTGTDWGWGDGDGVCAMADGVISEVRTLPDYGLIVKIDHGTLIDGKPTSTRYCHLASVLSNIKVGYEIKRGEDLGYMGATGSLAKGKHLHAELWLSGKRVDQQPYQKEKDVAANVRQIGSVAAKRREKPTVRGDGTADQNYDPAENFPPKTNVAWDYFVRSLLDGGSDDGDNIWFCKDGLFTKWTTTVPVPGDGALAGIKDGGTYPATTPPVTPPTTGGVTETQVKALIEASEKRVLAAIAKLPTAEQNGKASRDAIVK